MITNFEEQTHELTDYERKLLLPVVVQGLAKRIGSENAITNARMVEQLKKHGYTASGPRMRKVIHAIRIEGQVERLVATSKGYYVSNDPREIEAYVRSLHERANSILLIAKQLEYQNQKLNSNPKLYYYET